MSRFRISRVSRSLGAIALALATLGMTSERSSSFRWIPSTALAELGDAGQPTVCQAFIRITQAPSRSYAGATMNVTVEYGEAQSPPGEPACISAGSATTFGFYVNDVDRSSYFTTILSGDGFTNVASATDVPVDPGVLNVLVASTDGYDAEGNPTYLNDTRQFTSTAGATYSISVSAPAGPTTLAVTTTDTFHFRVQNTGTGTTSLSYTCSASGPISCGTVSPASGTIAAGAETSVAVTASAQSVTGQATLTLAASGSASGSATHTISITRPNPLSLAYTSGNRRLRAECPIIGAGAGAAVQCGDLVFAHGFPAYRTLNEARGLTLLYNSATAHPRPLVIADFTTTAGETVDLFHVEVIRSSNAVRLAEAYFDAAGYTQSVAQTRRFVLPVDASVHGLTTGAYPIEVRVSRRLSGNAQFETADVATTRLMVVDRRLSPFGAGWWPAGIDRLYPQSNGDVLLVGADASTVYFTANGASFVAPAGEHSVLSRLADGRYSRLLRGKRVTLTYSAQGLIETISDNSGNTGSYFWQAGGPDGYVLATITDPVGKTVTFDRTGEGRIWQIHIPGVAPILLNQGSATAVGAPLESISDPDQHLTTFTYKPGSFLLATSKARATGIFTYDYDGLSRVSDAVAPAGSPKQFRSWQLVGAAMAPTSSSTPATGALADSARLIVSWPRTVGGATMRDTVWFRVGPTGAPVIVKQPLVAATTITRDSIGRATRIQTAGGADVRQYWNAQGNMDSTSARIADASTGTGFRDDVTRYEFDPYWLGVTKITPPDQRAVVRVGYDGLGRRETMTDSKNRVTTFGYDARGLLETITVPDPSGQPGTGPRTTYGYDPVTQNLVTITDAVSQTVYHYDPLYGSDVRKVVNAHGDSTTYTYDAIKRPKTVTRVLNEQNELAVIGYDYDDVNRVRTQTDPLGRVSTSYADVAGRPTKSCVPGIATCDETYYHDGVNPTQLSLRNGTVLQEFDAAGRLTKKSFNGDVITMRYTDAGGNLTEIDNRYSRIRRTYDAYGRITCDNQQIRWWNQYNGQDKFEGASAWYAYDVNGRVQYTYMGAGTCATPIPTGDRQVHSYDQVGNYEKLQSTFWDAGTETWKWVYDGRDRVARLEMPTATAGQGNVTWTYDDFDRLTDFSHRQYIAEIQEHDSLGRVRQLCHWNGCGRTELYEYDRGGRLIESNVPTHEGQTFFTYDVGGNRLSDKEWEYEYATSTGRLDSRFGRNQSDCEMEYQYDLQGNEKVVGWTVNNECSRQLNREMTYDGTSQMVWSKTTTSAPSSCGAVQRDEIREFWYDGLGRRILMRSSNNCANDKGTWRYFWFGDHVGVKVYNGESTSLTSPTDVAAADVFWPALTRGAEVAGRGEWFLYGPGTDNLVGSLYFNAVGYTAAKRRLFYKDYRGSVVAVIQPDLTSAGVNSGAAYTPFGSGGGSAEGTAGYNAAEASGGLLYMRNRWYDPNSGRFTQEDPVGFAGGINLYAYAGNDPVTYSDPFGLLECSRDNPDECSFGDVLRNVAAGMAAVTSPEGGRDSGPGFRTGQFLGLLGFAVPVGVASRGATIADDALVVRGGTNTVDRIAAGAESIDGAGRVHGVSVNSGNGLSVTQLSRTIPNNQIGVTTAGAIRAAGGQVVADATRANPTHCLVSCISPEALSNLLTPTIRNPAK